MSSASPSMQGVWSKLAIVALVAGVLAFWDLGSRGLTNSEGHRVVPAIEFLERWDPEPGVPELLEGESASSRVLVPTMFHAGYLRKPPGFPWAIAGSMSVLGESESSARAVSALAGVAMALIGVVFGQRFFGTGLACGLAVALLPTALSSVRSAEIEAVNNLWTMLASLSIACLLVDPGRWRAALAVLAAVGLVGMTLVKGPAGLAPVGGVVLGAAIARRTWRVLVDPALLAAVGLAVAFVVGLGVLIARAVEGLPTPPVTQGVDEFLFEPEKLGAIALLPFESLVYQLPVSIAPLFAFGPFATRESAVSERSKRVVEIARTLAWGWVLALVISAGIGLSNPRYTLPAAPLAAVSVGYVVWGLRENGFVRFRRLIARALALGATWAWLVPMAGFAVGYIVIEERDRAAESGRDAGRSFAAAVEREIGSAPGSSPGAAVEVWADAAIEARPEVLWYAQLASRAIDGRWKPGWIDPTRHEPPGDGVILLLRDDERGLEVDAFREAGRLDGWSAFWSGEAKDFVFRAFRRETGSTP